MSFTPSIPASGQTLGNSRPQVLNNFASLRTTISNISQPNHIDVNNVGAGKHIFVQMPVQTITAANTPAANEGGLVTRTISAASELFYLRDASATPFQMTGPLFTGQGGLSNGGTTMLFGGIILKWGRVTTALGAQNLLFATECGSAFPTACFAVMESGGATGNFFPTNITDTGFTSNNAQGGTTIYFIAIGN